MPSLITSAIDTMTIDENEVGNKNVIIKNIDAADDLHTIYKTITLCFMHFR